MFEFLQVQYKLRRLDDVQLAKYVQVGCITSAEYTKICGKELG